MFERYAFPAAAANGADAAVSAEVMENVARTAHRATLVPASKFQRFRTHKHRFGSGVHVVWGIRTEGKPGPRGGRVYVHALMFDQKIYSPKQARKWLRAHGYAAKRFETAVPKGPLVPKKHRVQKYIKKYVRRVKNMLPENVVFQYVASMNPVKLMQVWQRGQKARKNPSLMILSNPRPKKAKRAPAQNLSHEIQLAQKAYKSFHFKTSDKHEKHKVPDGWPKVYVVLGKVDAFEVAGPAGKVKKRYGASKPILACDKNRRDVFIFSRNGGLGLPSGTAVRVDYSVPDHSGRLKWAKSWYHPHDSQPKVVVHKSGKALRISGPGLSVSPRGIIG